MAKDKKLGVNLANIFEEYNLLEQTDQLQKNGEQVQIELSKIERNPYQPRLIFNQKSLNELAQSIKEHGLITPILVTKNGDNYRLVAGERRVRASLIAGLVSIGAVIGEFSDDQLLELALIENIQRENLSVIEEARSYAKMLDHFRITIADLAKKVKKSRSHINNTLRLLRLPETVLNDINSGELTMGQVKPLINLKEERIIEIVERIKKEKLSSREVESIVKKDRQEEDEIIKLLNTKYPNLKFKLKESNKKMIIEYDNYFELSKFIDKLK